MQAEKIDEQKFEELCERLKIGVEVPRADTEAEKTVKRRSKPRLSAILAAALIIAAICATTVAAVGNCGWRMREFYKERNRPKGFTMMENPDENEGDIAITAVSDANENSLIEPKLVSIASDGHTVSAIVEVDIKDLDLPEEAKNSDSVGFYSVYSNLDYCNNYLPTLISKEGTVYSYACSFSPIWTMPEGSVTIELNNFGYDIGSGFEIAANGTFKFDIDSENIDTLGDKIKISGREQVKGATLQLQLSPLGLTVYGSYSELKKLGLYDDKYFLSQGDCFKFRMSDGSILGDEESFFDTDFYNIVTSVSGRSDIDTDVSCFHYGFIMPVDISEIEAVAVHDVWFELGNAGAETSENTETPAVTESSDDSENAEGTVTFDE